MKAIKFGGGHSPAAVEELLKGIAAMLRETLIDLLGQRRLEHSRSQMLRHIDHGAFLRFKPPEFSDDLKSAAVRILESVQEILHQKLARRQVPLRGLQYGEIQPAAGSSVRIRASIQQGIPMEKAREIMKMIKGSKVKVQASIQGDQLRVKGAKKDELQRVIELVKARDLDIDLQFVNYR